MGAVLRQFLVVILGADAVGMPRQHHFLDVRALRALRELIELLLAGGRELRSVEGEEHVGRERDLLDHSRWRGRRSGNHRRGRLRDRRGRDCSARHEVAGRGRLVRRPFGAATPAQAEGVGRYDSCPRADITIRGRWRIAGACRSARSLCSGAALRWTAGVRIAVCLISLCVRSAGPRRRD